MYDKRFMYEPGLKTPLIARGPGIQRSSTPDAMALNIDLAPTFMELAGLSVPDWMQGRSLVPILQGKTPSDWRTSIYYRYYHDPGHHNTRAHYGIRTATHKLIHYWKKDAYEMFHLADDPAEQHNLLFDPKESERAEVQATFEELKSQLKQLQQQYGDEGQYADPESWPKGGADGPFNDRLVLGKKSVADAMVVSVDQTAPQ